MNKLFFRVEGSQHRQLISKLEIPAIENYHNNCVKSSRMQKKTEILS